MIDPDNLREAAFDLYDALRELMRRCSGAPVETLRKASAALDKAEGKAAPNA